MNEKSKPKGSKVFNIVLAVIGLFFLFVVIQVVSCAYRMVKTAPSLDEIRASASATDEQIAAYRAFSPHGMRPDSDRRQ
jgi:hypothetical protein